MNPATTLAEVAAFDPAIVWRGYWLGLAKVPMLTDDAALWHGWRVGLADAGLATSYDQLLLLAEWAFYRYAGRP